MNDYPRPPVEPTPKPFLPDRIVGGVAALIYVGLVVYWMLQMSRRVNFQAVVSYYWLYVLVTLIFAALHLWLFASMAKGRSSAFVALTILVGIELAGTAFYGDFSSAIYNFPIWVYCVARLFGLLGAKPGK
jgi:hypothetical protein